MLKFTLMMVMMIFIKNKSLKISMAMFVININFSLQDNLTQKISYFLMGDTLSFWTFNLAAWLIFVVSLMKSLKPKVSSILAVLILICFHMAFFTWNFLVFFISFEMLMTLILMVVVSWSYQPERVDAILFMIILTLMFSLPFFVSLMINFKYLNFWMMNKMNLHLFFYISIILVFMMKLPTYFMHIWLPKLHVESPVQGSMILAAVMLKLGCYGLMRVTPMMHNFKLINIIIVSISIWSMMILSMICFTQADIKMLIAYSSIVHMTLTLMSIMMNKTSSMMASLIIMITHGLCSSMMFFAAMACYKISKSRSLLLNVGILNISPATKLTWFVLCMSNTPMPPFLSMMGEILVLKNLCAWSPIMYFLMFIISIMAASFSIFLFYGPSHSNWSKTIKLSKTINLKFFIISMIHILPLISLSIKPMIFSM